MQKMLIIGLLLASSLSLSSWTTNAESLSKNDQLFREDIQYRLSARLQNQIMTVIGRYKAKIATMNKTDANRLTENILQKLETILYKMRAAQSADKTLEQKASNVYLAYILLKFELMLLK